MSKSNTPTQVMFISILGYISGIANIAAGIFLILDKNSLELIVKSGHSSSELFWYGVWAIVIGSIIIALASALSNGSRAVQLFYGILAAFHVAGGLWGVIALHGHNRSMAALSLVFSVIILVLLFNAKSEAFFKN